VDGNEVVDSRQGMDKGLLDGIKLRLSLIDKSVVLIRTEASFLIS